jgi:mono/diheme cytochrome c family protein
MSHKRLLPALIGVVLFAAIHLPFAFGQKPVPTTESLPPGAMQAKATSACMECHGARIILQQRLSKTAWGKEVDKMTKWGAVVDPADRDALIDYLSTNFGPDQTAYDPPRSSSTKTAAQKSK